ncbi:hypothetical protein AMAG_11527 [Allomyces macrogynus ATCC 38327]|uniref:Integral membrane protein n=1 Tax=Allomyces macrogynus (strain ATCC 38327) TaxID=578462 RepID=A0A0L0SVG5_ALLM3|nr:hypothetical protein AMAG_11527 [Allomyces macrogynus ATCC 38327]|eukprot:KNE66385.1 hypothetical protein AMAG_11527 [Allomyces macrogynus ATCC 38327]
MADASEPVFKFSAISFGLGICVAIDVSTLTTAVTLYRRAGRSIYYILLGIIAVAHILDLAIGFAGDAHTKDSALLQALALLFAWVGGCGFVGLNMARFHSVGMIQMPTLTKALLVLTGISILLCTANNAMFAYTFITYGANGEEQLPLVDVLFSAWSVYDSLVNLGISLGFIAVLRSIGGKSGHELRKNFHELLGNVRWVLGLECALMIAANVIVQAADFDPQWVTVYIAESIRMRFFCYFLLTLSRMLKKKVKASYAQPIASHMHLGGGGGPSHLHDVPLSVIHIHGGAGEKQQPSGLRGTTAVPATGTTNSSSMGELHTSSDHVGVF